MSVEMKVDHLSQRERYIMSLVYASISSLSDEAYAIANVHHIVALADRLEPVERSAGGVDDPLSGKYSSVLRPFVALMETELHANAGKGDRPGWLQMDRKTALLEIFYHLAKLQKAAKDDDANGIREYAADVANMAMMLVDVCGQLEVALSPRADSEGGPP